jgi:hypothetical protein
MVAKLKMMSFEIDLIKHKNLKEEELLEICKVKSISWKYFLYEHRRWINDNINEEDLHFCLKNKLKTIGYLNLVKRKLKINNVIYDIWGVGNVCASEKGTGIGKELMNRLNVFFNNKKCYSLLLCKDSLIDFYKKFGWKVIYRSEKVNYMINENLYKNVKKIEQVELIGKEF